MTADEKLDDAIAAFGLLCDRAIEYLDLLGWEAPPSVSTLHDHGAPGSTAV